MPASLTAGTAVVLVSRRWGRLRRQPSRRQVITETVLELYVDGLHTATFSCLNEYLEEMALGYLYTAGLIDSLSQVGTLSWAPEALRLTLTPKAPSPGPGDGAAPGLPPPLSMSRTWRLMRAFSKRSPLFAASGGVHSALLLHEDFQLFNEDIGRHNCIDKIAGRLLKAGGLAKTADAVMLSSGRVSGEIMSKLLRLGIPAFVSRTTPTARAVELARTHNVTLLGYVRGRRAVIYAGQERITA
jgi:FdhD protein